VKHTDELIADQAKQIYVLEKFCKQYLENVRTVNKMIYCIGGPLNDNKLQYNKEQLQLFFRIVEELEMVKDFDDEE
jgi:hypothetical protein